MEQSARLSKEEQYLQVANKKSENHSNHSLMNVVDVSVIENIVFSKVSPLFYKTKVHLSLSVSEEFKENFGLIKGLIEFHRSRRFLFEYNFTQKAIETDIEISQLRELQVFLCDVSIWLNREIQFKQNLKIVLEFENRYKLAKAEVYALINKAAD